MLTNRIWVPSALGAGREKPGAGLLAPDSWLALLHAHEQCGAPVQAARFLARVVVLRPLFAIADRAQAIGADAAAGEVLADRRRTAFAEREVVLGRADVAG